MRNPLELFNFALTKGWFRLCPQNEIGKTSKERVEGQGKLSVR